MWVAVMGVAAAVWMPVPEAVAAEAAEPSAEKPAPEKPAAAPAEKPAAAPAEKEAAAPAEKPAAAPAEKEAAAPVDRDEEWRTHVITAEQAFRRRDFARAEAELSAAVKVAEAFGSDDKRLAVSLARLMQVYAVQGKHAEAIGPGKRLLALRESALGPKHIDVADALNNLASLNMDSDKPDEAKPLLERALAICKATDRGAERLHAIVLDNLAELQRDKGNLEAAEPLARQGLALRKEQYGGSHRWYAKSLETVGTILSAKGQHAEAEETFRECLTIRRMKVGWNRPILIRSLVHLADACKAQKKYEAAENYYKRAIQQGQGGLGRNDDVRADAYEAYADLLRQTDRADEAQKMADQAKTIREALEK